MMVCDDPARKPVSLMGGDLPISFCGICGGNEKLKAATNADEPIIIAKEAGFMISFDDLKSAQSEISDEELEEASGGTGGWVKASLKAGKTSVICAIPITVAVSVKYC